jgi:O-antigen/teichoic acid export membrane protein
MKKSMKKNSFVEGTVVAYISILVTKIIGALYVIPFYNIIGTDGGILYSYAYNVYNLFLNISISGIPTAVAIIIAEYNALKKFNERERTFHLANKAIGIIALISFLLMFIFAKYIGLFFVGDLQDGTDINSIVLVIRTISLCLLVIPFLSVLRGYLQGNKYLNDPSNSQLIEQVVRIIVVLVGSYVAINLLHYETHIGVSAALSGTVLGGIAAYLYLRYRLSKSKLQLKEGVTSLKETSESDKKIINKIIKYSIPIIIVSVTQNIYEISDMKLVIRGLYMIGYSASRSEYLASIIVTWTPKICMIINALAIGLCTSVIPFVVTSFTEKNFDELNRKFNQAINIILMISIPLSAYIVVFSEEVYRIFYGASNEGKYVLCVMTIISILFSLQLVINMILQGMKKFKLVYINTLVGLAINISLDIPMILILNKTGILPPYLGTLLATIIGLFVSELIVAICLRKEFRFKYRTIVTTLLKTLLGTIFMACFLILIKKFLFTTEVHRLVLIGELGIICLGGLGIFILISYFTGLVDQVLGNDFFKKFFARFKRKSKDL